MKGAQPGHHVRLAEPQEYHEWLDLNVIKQVTVAPEFLENQAFIRECVKRGIFTNMDVSKREQRPLPRTSWGLIQRRKNHQGR
jgi:N-acetylglucosamine-6-phosphate deacetylase